MKKTYRRMKEEFIRNPFKPFIIAAIIYIIALGLYVMAAGGYNVP